MFRLSLERGRDKRVCSLLRCAERFEAFKPGFEREIEDRSIARALVLRSLVVSSSVARRGPQPIHRLLFGESYVSILVRHSKKHSMLFVSACVRKRVPVCVSENYDEWLMYSS